MSTETLTGSACTECGHFNPNEESELSQDARKQIEDLCLRAIQTLITDTTLLLTQQLQHNSNVLMGLQTIAAARLVSEIDQREFAATCPE